MCGFFASNIPLNSEEAKVILGEHLRFRGPDFQSDIVRHFEWNLYHARLTIISDNPAYNQPYRSRNGSTLLFNGEIFNFRELCEKYLDFTSTSDTEVLAHLLDQSEFDLAELDGFFAFIRLDSNGNVTHCARDKFGVKPLFYFQPADGGLAVASEPSVLAKIFHHEVSSEAIEEYRVFRAPIFSGSFYSGIHQVEPGTCLVNGPYFHLSRELQVLQSPSKLVTSSLEERVVKSVRSREISDFPVGVLYSGGIDSNIVAHFAQQDSKKLTGDIAPNSYDFKFSETQKATDPNLHTFLFSKKEFLDRLNNMLSVRQEPLSVPNEVILSLIASKWAEMSGKVLLSGEAADEFFGGYDRIFRWSANAVDWSTREFLKHYAYVEYSRIPNEIVAKTENLFAQCELTEPFDLVRYFFIKVHLPLLFRRLDFALMFSGIEGREPLASYLMFEYAASLTKDDLLNSTHGKLPLRELAAAKFGKEFAYREKVGFPIDTQLEIAGVESKSRQDNYEFWTNYNLETLGW